MTDKDHSQPQEDALTYGDSEASVASGVPVPSLRVLQSAGAISAVKIAKDHGGFRRSWPQEEVLKASIASAMGTHFGWNIRIVSEAMAKTPAGTWDALVAFSLLVPEVTSDAGPILIKASAQDWYLELVDRKFLFLNITPEATAMLQETQLEELNLLLGTITKDNFFPIPWAFGNTKRRAAMAASLDPDTYRKARRIYQVAVATRKNFLSSATINASIHIRMAAHRLDGRPSKKIQDLFKP